MDMGQKQLYLGIIRYLTEKEVDPKVRKSLGKKILSLRSSSVGDAADCAWIQIKNLYEARG